MEPEWSDFKVLLALASAGSVAGAARELQVDNSTVSRRLAALEEAVGAKLHHPRRARIQLDRRGPHRCLPPPRRWTRPRRKPLRSVRNVQGRSGGHRPRLGVARLRADPDALMLPALRDKHPGLRVELGGDFPARRPGQGRGRYCRPHGPAERTRSGGAPGVRLRLVRLRVEGVSRRQWPARVACRRWRSTGWCFTSKRCTAFRRCAGWNSTAARHGRCRASTTSRSPARPSPPTAALPCCRVSSPMPCPTCSACFATSIGVNTGWIVYHETVRDAARIRAVVDALLEFFERNAAMFSGVETGRGAGKSK